MQSGDTPLTALRDALFAGLLVFAGLSAANAGHAYHQNNKIRGNLDCDSFYVGCQQFLSPPNRVFDMWVYNEDIDNDGRYNTVGLQWDPQSRAFDKYELTQTTDESKEEIRISMRRIGEIKTG